MKTNNKSVKKKPRISKDFVIEEKWEKILEMAKYGYTHDEISDFIGIARSTFQKYLSVHLDKADAIKRQKVHANTEIENAMQKRALGYEYVEEHLEYVPGGIDGKTMVKIVKKIKKYEPPNVTAGIFLLKNRRPANYKDRHEIDMKIIDKDQAKKEIEELFE